MSKDLETKVEETVEQVIETVEGEVEDMKEKKKGFAYKVGEITGKVTSGIRKTVKSKPFKIAAVVTGMGLSAKAGYEYGKRNSTPCIEGDLLTSTDETNFNDVEEPKAD